MKKDGDNGSIGAIRETIERLRLPPDDAIDDGGVSAESGDETDDADQL